jgi:DMSO/TMAO reductase YedYZ molybdopterin-dependent catalytic subunit
MMDRRSFLTLTTLAPLAPATMVEALRAQAPLAQKRVLQLNSYTLNAETPLDLLTDFYTDDLFFVRSHWIPTRVDRDAWTLTVDGAVSRPLHLELADLEKLPKVEATCVLQCAGNGRSLFRPTMPGVQWRYGAVGNARWGGVRVKDVLERAGLKGSARHLHTFGSDAPPRQVPPFHRSLEIEKVLQDGLIAYEMNGEPLSHEHGAPARLVVPGWAGDHWMKWLRQISPSTVPQTGFYMDTAYRYPPHPGEPGQAFKPEEMQPVTEIFVKSNIASAPPRARVGAPIALSGFAFSGAPDIAKVEITGDGGLTWRAADLDRRHDPYAWRLWSYTWTPASAGTHRLAVRATDSHGRVQPKEPAWNQSGYLHNGWHSVTIEVTS